MAGHRALGAKDHLLPIELLDADGPAPGEPVLGVHEAKKEIRAKGVTIFDAPPDYAPAFIKSAKKVLASLEAKDLFFKKVLEFSEPTPTSLSPNDALSASRSSGGFELGRIGGASGLHLPPSALRGPMNDNLPTATRVSDPGIRALYRLERRWQAWLDVEVALAKAQAELGIIPAEAADVIARAARLELLDRARIDEGLARTGHTLVPLVWELARVVGEPHGGLVHWPASTET